MQAIVDADSCTGCGLCVDICPEVFELSDDVALVIVNPVPENSLDECREAEESCPVEAISLEED